MKLKIAEIETLLETTTSLWVGISLCSALTHLALSRHWLTRESQSVQPRPEPLCVCALLPSPAVRRSPLFASAQRRALPLRQSSPSRQSLRPLRCPSRATFSQRLCY